MSGTVTLSKQMNILMKDDPLAKFVRDKNMTGDEHAAYREKLEADVARVNDFFGMLMDEAATALEAGRLPRIHRIGMATAYDRFFPPTTHTRPTGLEGLNGQIWNPRSVRITESGVFVIPFFRVAEHCAETFVTHANNMAMEDVYLRIRQGHDGGGMSSWFDVNIIGEVEKKLFMGNSPRPQGG